MVQNAGSPGLQRQIIKAESLRSLESRYEEVLVELGKVIEVKSGVSEAFLLRGTTTNTQEYRFYTIYRF